MTNIVLEKGFLQQHHSEGTVVKVKCFLTHLPDCSPHPLHPPQTSPERDDIKPARKLSQSSAMYQLHAQLSQSSQWEPSSSWFPIDKSNCIL